MSGMQGVRRSGPEPHAREESSAECCLDSGVVVVVRGGGRGDEVVSSPQERAALYSLAYAYGALLRETNPEYDWVVEVLE